MTALRSAVIVFFIAASAFAQNELTGLWEAKQRYGPDVRGTLTVARDASGWRAEIAGRGAPVAISGERITFTLPNGEGAFTGRIGANHTKITGHWLQPVTMTNGTGYASPVTLTLAAENVWRGEVVPLDDDLRLYLRITPRDDGTLGAFLRNPERNLQHFVAVDRLDRDGDRVRLRDTKSRVVGEGLFRDGVLSLQLQRTSGTFDFHRVEAGQPSDFYPRGMPSVPYVYRPPTPRDDGWPVASVDDVGISREAITRFMQILIDEPMDKPNAIEFHGLLIARHGKLVVEEYFHGEHGDKPHDTRSAAKSITSTLIGAAMESGVPLSPNDRVYAVMNGGKLPPDLDPRKQAMTLEHLMTMSSGFYCDDTDPNAPGNEDNVQDQTAHPDWYELALGLPMASDPGTHAVYCSIQPHLAGGLLSRAAAKPLPQLFDELLAKPLQINRYWMNLTPDGAAYMGGGVRFLPRDFMKLAQLMMNGGTWQGRRIVPADFARRATSPLVTIGKRGYGYFWWVDDRPYAGRTTRTYLAGGNGGQIAMAVPELDLVIGFWGGNYSDRATFTPQDVYVPQFILPAVDPAK